MKLTYFAIPGRAEVARLIFTVGNVPFEDHHVDFKKWPEVKPTTPFGQVPILELDDGRVLAQSGAIERYAAKLAGLVPADPVTAAFADQWAIQASEIVEVLAPTNRIEDPEAKIKARQELLATKVTEKLKILAKAVEHSQYLAGSELSHADITAFVVLSVLQSGFYDGIPKSALDEYPTLKAWHHKIASIDAIKAYYANATGVRLAFQP